MATKKAPAKVRGVYERDPGSGIWWIQYKQGTVRKREKVGRRSDAIALYQQRKSELRAGAKLAPNLRARAVTFGTLAAEALAWSAEFHPKDIRTVTGRMKTLTAEFGGMTATDITPQILDRWLSEHDQWTPATKNRYRALLSLVYRQGMRNGKVTTNPARLVAARAESNGRIRYLSDKEEEALRKVMLKEYPHHIPALDVSLNTGMRLSEQFTLTWGDVDLVRREIVLDKTKNGSSRRIPMNSVCFRALELLAADDHGPDEAIFRAANKKPIKRPRKWFEAALKAAKITDYTWHSNRHTFCSRLAMAGVDVRTIAALAGHKTLQMAMRYSHLSPSHNLSAIERLTQRPSQAQDGQPG